MTMARDGGRGGLAVSALPRLPIGPIGEDFGCGRREGAGLRADFAALRLMP
jgi:hypothetical protein